MNDPYICKTQHILSGKIEQFSRSEILKLLMHMNDKDTPINTLMIQKSYDGSYCVKVDECTVDAYKKHLEKRRKQMRKCKGITNIYKDGKWYREEFKLGYFHQWGCNYEEFESGAGNYSVAIVELPDGRIIMPSPDDIVFLEPIQEEKTNETNRI